MRPYERRRDARQREPATKGRDMTIKTRDDLAREMDESTGATCVTRSATWAALVGWSHEEAKARLALSLNAEALGVRS